MDGVAENVQLLKFIWKPLQERVSFRESHIKALAQGASGERAQGHACRSKDACGLRSKDACGLRSKDACGLRSKDACGLRSKDKKLTKV